MHYLSVGCIRQRCAGDLGSIFGAFLFGGFDKVFEHNDYCLKSSLSCEQVRYLVYCKSFFIIEKKTFSFD